MADIKGMCGSNSVPDLVSLRQNGFFCGFDKARVSLLTYMPEAEPRLSLCIHSCRLLSLDVSAVFNCGT